jgi:hypothetical protein
MLHLADCEHFDEDKPPREATPHELASLPGCSDCEERLDGPKGGRGGRGEANRFVCASCHLNLPLALRRTNGLRIDCSGE